MTDRRCANCGTPEQRGIDGNGRPRVNLNPLTGLCVKCTVSAATGRRTFHSRRDDRKGEVIDTKALPFDGRAAAARNDE
jgi:hypothetical protein